MNIEPVQLNPQVEALLTQAGLPVSDLREARGLQLFAMRADERLTGVVGIEVHGAAGLLRSLAVDTPQRNGGQGKALVSHVESWATQRGIKALYLLTTTAAEFFAHLGYEAIPRSAAPPAIAGTGQFTGLCPSSSIFMRKVLAASSTRNLTK
jgi:amino-acid N-acetyltransferase